MSAKQRRGVGMTPATLPRTGQKSRQKSSRSGRRAESPPGPLARNGKVKSPDYQHRFRPASPDEIEPLQMLLRRIEVSLLRDCPHEAHALIDRWDDERKAKAKERAREQARAEGRLDPTAPPKPGEITDDSPIAELGLPVRLMNGLEKNGVDTVGELKAAIEHMWAWSGFGPEAVKACIEAVEGLK